MFQISVHFVLIGEYSYGALKRLQADEPIPINVKVLRNIQEAGSEVVTRRHLDPSWVWMGGIRRGSDCVINFHTILSYSQCYQIQIWILERPPISQA